PKSGLPTIAASALPSEAQSTLALIDRGGPYPYKQDNTVFSNFEGLLPKRPSGYYREYTVVTPGSPDRGTRRLVVGKNGDIYYTDDHYESFRQVVR
ncbi:MAG TPA: ribonuclease domain-containing protein, partial [Micromonosporaceae bacterium]